MPRTAIAGRRATERMFGVPSLLLALAFGACGSSSYPVRYDSDSIAKGLAPPAAPSAQAMPLRAGSDVEVRFLYTPELTVRQPVRPDGRITLPLVGDVAVSDKVADELRVELLGRFAAHLVKPEIAVIVHSTPWSRVFVGGEVKQPGVFPLPGPTTALEVLMQAGGANLKDADLSSVIVVRQQNGVHRGIALDLEPALRGEVALPFYLQPGDVVFVPRTGMAKIDNFIEQIFRILPNQFFYRQTFGDVQLGIGEQN